MQAQWDVGQVIKPSKQTQEVNFREICCL